MSDKPEAKPVTTYSCSECGVAAVLSPNGHFVHACGHSGAINVNISATVYGISHLRSMTPEELAAIGM